MSQKVRYCTVTLDENLHRL